MPTVFVTRPGFAIRLPEDIPSAMLLTVGGAGGNLATSNVGSFATHKSVITELAIQQQGNYQFLHSLQDLIYVYVFGERIGEIRIAGLSFAGTCAGGVASPGMTGIEHILQYYDQSRISATGQPYQIVIGATGQGRARGFLVDINVHVDRPEARLARFGLRFKAFKQ